MGRKQSTVTQYYEMTRDEQSKCQKARCKFCGWSSAKNTVRMKVHLAKTCTACPEPVKAVFAADLEESETESSSEESDQSGSGTALLETSRTSEKRRKKGQTLPKSRKKKKKHRLTATDRSILLQEEHQEIDRALADYLFAANLPLSTIENPYFVTFCKKLRPTYQLPTRHRVVTQSFLQSATPVSQVQQPMTTYYQTGGQETSNLASTSAGLSVPMMHAQGPHQVPGVISSPESQQPGTFHLVRITNT